MLITFIISTIVLLFVSINYFIKSNMLLKKTRDLEDKSIQSQTELKILREKENIIKEAKEELSQTFKSLSYETLKNNNEIFLNSAKKVFETQHKEANFELQKKHTAIEELIKPVKETLNNFDKKLHSFEKESNNSFTSLNVNINNLLNTNNLLKKETNTLVQALKTPQVKGRWGEEQLKKLVELAGMLNYCDFEEQVQSSDNKLRPDLIIKLPGGKNIIVDAKVSTEAYIEALNYTDEDTIKLKLKEHARQIREQINKLKTKNYWEQFEPSPEFVVMFIPGENFFSAALQADPSLIEEGVKNKVILASPTTLLSLLKVIHYGWKQELITESTKEIGELSIELYERLNSFLDNIYLLGDKINQVTDLYNKTTSKLESRVLVSGRKLETLLNSDKKLKELKHINKQAKTKN